MKDKIEQIELLPCPICQGDAHIFWDVDPDETEPVTWYRVECQNLRCVSTSNYLDEDNPVRIWNTRTESPELLRLRDALAAAEKCVGHYADVNRWNVTNQCSDMLHGAAGHFCSTRETDYNHTRANGYDYAVKAQAEIKRLKGE